MERESWAADTLELPGNGECPPEIHSLPFRVQLVQVVIVYTTSSTLVNEERHKTGKTSWGWKSKSLAWPALDWD